MICDQIFSLGHLITTQNLKSTLGTLALEIEGENVTIGYGWGKD